MVVLFLCAAPALGAARWIARGETHEYALSAGPAQLVELELEAADVDLEVSAVSPRGTVLAAGTTKFSRRLAFPANAAGRYLVRVHASPRTTLCGRYELTFVHRPADERRLAAQRDFLAAAELLGQQKAAAARAAIAHFEAALRAWRDLGDPWREAETLHAIGVAHGRLTKHREAIVHHERALSIRRALGDESGEAASLDAIGFAHEAITELPKAREAFEASLALHRRLGTRRGEARLLTGLAAVLQRTGKVRESFELLDRAQRVNRELDDRAGEILTLRWIGNAWITQGEKSRSRELSEQALAIARELDDHTEIGLLLNNIAVVLGYESQWERAIELFEQAAALYAEGGQQAEEAAALINIGVGWGTLGDHRKAIDIFERALPMSRALGDRGREVFILVYLGIAHAELSESVPALKYLATGLEMSRQMRLPRVEALALHHLAKMHHAAGEYDAALLRYGDVLRIAREAGNRRGESHALINLGSVLGSMGRCEEARTRFDAAMAVARQTEDRVSEGAALWRIAQLDRDEGQLFDALERAEAAVAIAESVRSRFTAQQFRAAYLATVRDQYDLQIDILMRLHERSPDAGFDVLALQASERARARSLVETLEAAQVAGTVSSPRYGAHFEPGTLALAEIRQLLDDDTMLLEISLGAHRSHAWAVTADSLRSYALPPRPAIDALARRVHALASTRPRSPAERRRLDDEYRAAAAELSTMLLGPLAQELRGQRLVVAAEGALQYIPFAALPSPGSREPLAARHEIVIVPSAATLELLRRGETRAAAENTLMIFADPVFSPTDPRVQASRGASNAVKERMARLPLTRLEAASIAKLVPDDAITTALDFDASRATATGDAIRRHRIVHFATHGLLNSVQPELSGVVLSLVDKKGRAQDGFLRLHDIYNLRLDADLVVLSACQTALGKEIRGEGMVGLTRGFMYAGVPRVVASLWKVDDRATAELMRRFYESMLGPRRLPPAAALRAAQVEMAESAMWGRPYYWAGFVLQGEWR